MGKPVEIKTKETTASVEDFLNKVEDDRKREDSFVILRMMAAATGDSPRMWGAALIGFGNVRYRSPQTGREVEWFRIGFSPRKANISLHLMSHDVEALKKLGKHKTGAGCVYINKLSDVDLQVLEELIRGAVMESDRRSKAPGGSA